MDATIRQATEDDAATIAHVHVASWRSTYAGIVPDAYLQSLDVEARAQSWRERLAARKAIFFTAEDDAQVCGFVCGGEMREGIAGYDAELYAIYLLRDRQRRGIGRRLTEALVGSLRAAGFRSMGAWVLKRNPAVQFYESLGAIQIGEKLIEIGGVQLEELALGWPDLDLSFPRHSAASADAA
jgi:ribosomal protein S18 acetylase RimI-like enzyme